ncbi:MAG: hypothetical protein D6705_14020 [Deltaproteobacteria bacterium]|nr:MAG: hypothetical protein D6705_14020 [Deltaproteobacteria bacterium]
MTANRVLAGVCCTSLVLSGGGCASAPRPDALEVRTVESRAEGRPLPVSIYRPPAWDGRTPLPLVVFLHGGGDDARIFERHGEVVARLDAAIAAGHVPPVIVAVPEGELGFWRNWADGSHRYEDWVVDEAIPFVRREVPVLDAPAGQHVLGVSMGGAGALYLGLDHPEAFGTISVLSAPIFDVDRTMDFLAGKYFRGIPTERIFGTPDRAEVEAHNAYARLSSPEALEGRSLLVGAGTRDRRGIAASTAAFHAHLERHGVPHHYLVYRGGHRYRDWAKVFPFVLCVQLRPDADCSPLAGSIETYDAPAGRDRGAPAP